MDMLPKVYICKEDYQKLVHILDSLNDSSSALLLEEISRADIVEEIHLPANTVKMYSHVTYQDLELEEPKSVRLVYPSEAQIEANKISVLSPIGSALLGLQVGSIIRWPMPNGKYKSIQILKVED